MRLLMTLPSTAAPAARSRRRRTEPEAVVAIVVEESEESYVEFFSIYTDLDVGGLTACDACLNR